MPETQASPQATPSADAMADLFAPAATAPAPITTVVSQPLQSTGSLVALPPVTLIAISEQELLPRDKLPPQVLEEVKRRAAAISFENSVGVLTYGKGSADAIDAVLDKLLAGVSTEDAGVIGDVITELKTGINELELDKINEELKQMGAQQNGEWSVRGFMRHIPGIGRAFSHVENFMERKQEIVKKFGKIRDKLEGRMVSISDYLTKLDLLSKESVGYTQQLALDIMAGQLRLADGGADFERRRQVLLKSDNPNSMEAAQESGALRELSARLSQFDSRLDVMKRRFVEVASVGRLRNMMTQEAGNTELSNIQSVVMFTLPHMKEIVLSAASEIAIKRAQSDGRSADEADEKATKAATALLHDVYIAAKEAQGRELSKVELLQHVADQMVATLDAGDEIDKKTSEMRKQAEAALIKIGAKVRAAEVKVPTRS